MEKEVKRRTIKYNEVWEKGKSRKMVCNKNDKYEKRMNLKEKRKMKNGGKKEENIKQRI